MNQQGGSQPGGGRSERTPGEVALLAIAAIALWLGRMFGGEVSEEFGRPIIPRWIKRAVILGIGIILLFAAIVCMRFWTPPAPAQPIPFSHRIHVTTKKLSCMFCHPNPDRSSNAGLPPVEKCMLCHSRIATNFHPIRQVVDHYRRGESIHWVRVYYLPDFVRFNHQCHWAGGHDCGECHGNVAQMDRVGCANRIDMNFCVTCHWRNGVTDNCFACHY